MIKLSVVSIKIVYEYQYRYLLGENLIYSSFNLYILLYLLTIRYKISIKEDIATGGTIQIITEL